MKTETEKTNASAATTAHTPGPWKLSPPLGEGDFAVLSDKVNAGGNFYVATLPNGAHAEAAANARLLAAAPDLLAALKDCMALVDRGELVRDTTRDHDPRWYMNALELVRVLQQAQAAIAKVAQP